MKFTVLLLLATSCLVSPLTVPAQTPILINTFTNPTPAAGSYFGTRMTALGNDRVLVGARTVTTTPTSTNVGAVYLFHTNGSLLTTFTNPISDPNQVYSDYWFGGAIATLGSDRVVIGSPYDGKVYLFATNGALVKTISPIDRFSFGAALAAFGNDKVLIGMPEAVFEPDTIAPPGVAYLYSTNGSRLATFSNPDPDYTAEFGYSLAAFGSDRVLVGAYFCSSAAAYLFSANGTLLTNFTMPAPNLPYGPAVAAAGTDHVLISATGADGATTNAGSVWVFNTNGILLTTITNPTPASYDNFGSDMAMLGNDRVVIGAFGDDTTGTNAGSAYLFDVNGTLLATLNNPTPANYDYFGYRVVSFGSEGVILGAPYDDTGVTNAGTVYLFSVPSQPSAPSLTIQMTASNTVAVSWPSPSTGFVLEENSDGMHSMNWSNVTAGIQDDGTNKSLIVNPTGLNRFYRLAHP